MRAFQAVRIEGGLFAPDLLDRLLAEDLPGQKPRDFGLDGRRGLTDEISAVFADATDLWRVFKHRLEKLREDDPGTSITRDNWVVPFLGLIGYELYFNRKAYTIDGLTFAISHRAGEHDDTPPVHIVGVNQELGRLAPSGRPRLAPHSLLQEFLNRTDALWGIVTNGMVLRILRDSTYIRRQCYVEFDLEAIFEQRLFQDFVILYRLLHRTRLPKSGADASQCLLEKYYQDSLAQGGRVRERLRDGVEECIKLLANGFLAHSKNEELRQRVIGDERRITPEDLYRQLLRLVYRFLFLLVSEDRGLISSNPLYLKNYSVIRLRQMVDDRSAYTDHHDLWLSFRLLWRLLSVDKQIPRIGNKPPAALLDLPVLDGELFEPIDLDECYISNEDLLKALWYLINYQDSPSSPPRRVNYAALDVEELGSVYESLLDYHPSINTIGIPKFELLQGSERKSTGSYYTPAELVGELVRSALEPVVDDRLKGVSNRKDQEDALLSIKVVDPACGSGHFLLAATRYLGKRLARIRTGNDEPAPEHVRRATRDVITHCIYGVDKNPLAVELCRVALWIESHVPGRPLTFLDHRIRCGDSLLGVTDLGVLERGIPEEAFTAVSGDDKRIASSVRRHNKRELSPTQSGLADFGIKPEIDTLAAWSEALNSIPDESFKDIEEKRKRYESQRRTGERLRTACDIWTAAFFQRFEGSGDRIITATLQSYLRSGEITPQVEYALNLAARHRFFHWPLEFPEVFKNGGFDVVLGNPPWERIKLQKQEFFATRDPEIANAPNAAAREKLIKKLGTTRPDLWKEYRDALHAAESTSRFLHGSGLYPLTGHGDINTYSVFAERMRGLLRQGGRAGIIVPSGIATDDTKKQFFADLVDRGELISLFDFENRKKLFPDVDSRYKFCLLTVTRGTRHTSPEFVFFATNAEHLRDQNRRFTLSPAVIARINPNTKTLPIFRTRQDADITRAIYERVPVLINERTGENPWGVRFLAMFHMANDSHLFRTRDQLERVGFRAVGNRFVRGDEVYLPLYEAKMIWHYDHRYGTYDGVQDRSNTHLPNPDSHKHADAAFLAQPWYWVPKKEVEERLGKWKRGWLMGWRDVTNATNERTVIASVVPGVGYGNKFLLMLPTCQSLEVAKLVGNLATLVFDYCARQKIGGVSMNYFTMKQLPCLPPTAYSAEDLRFIVPRVLELVYTAWDIKPYANDIWREADDDLRDALKRQWDENAQETGGHDWDLPEWIEAYPDIETDPEKGIPLPPFKWDENRRARIQAELDAYYARLYGLTRKQLRYILDPADLTEKELEDILDPWEEVDDPLDPQGYETRTAASTFPGETFRVLKEKEIRDYGEYRTRRLVLEAWERLGEMEDA